MLAGNPLLWGKGGGSYSAADANREVATTYTDHIPTTLAVVLIGAGLVLIALDRGGFEIGVSARAGAGRG